MLWATDMTETLAARRQQAEAAFAAAAASHGLLFADGIEESEAPVTVWQEKKGDAPEIIASFARFFDLVVLGRSNRVIYAPHTDAIEQTVLLSGRPVLLAPANPPDVVGDTVAFAWNGSAQAVRALVNALPFLQLAKQTMVILVGPIGPTGIDDRQGLFACARCGGPIEGDPVGGGPQSGHTASVGFRRGTCRLARARPLRSRAVARGVAGWHHQ